MALTSPVLSSASVLPRSVNVHLRFLPWLLRVSRIDQNSTLSNDMTDSDTTFDDPDCQMIYSVFPDGRLSFPPSGKRASESLSKARFHSRMDLDSWSAKTGFQVHLLSETNFLKQAWSHDYVVGLDTLNRQALKKVLREHPLGQVERRQASERSARVRVHVRADYRELVVRQILERRSLGQYLAKLDMVLLAAAFLAGLQRVAVIQMASLSAARTPFDHVEIYELVSAIRQYNTEQTYEFIWTAEGLDVIQRLDDAALRVFRHHQASGTCPQARSPRRCRCTLKMNISHRACQYSRCGIAP